MSRVLLCHGRPAEEQALRAGNLDLLLCDDSESLLEEVVTHRPDVLIYELRPDSNADLAVLRILRTVAPRLPIVIVGDEESESWRMPADLRPLYYAPLPVEERELHGTIENALAPGATP
jgi:DNA-binding NtrC family response regulator